MSASDLGEGVRSGFRKTKKKLKIRELGSKTAKDSGGREV